MKTITINKREYNVQENEFFQYTHPEYNYLNIIPEVGILERHTGLMNDIAKDLYKYKKDRYLYIVGEQYETFVQNNCSEFKTTTSIFEADFVYVHNNHTLSDTLISIINSLENRPFILSPDENYKIYQNYKHYQLSRLETIDSVKKYVLYVPESKHLQFIKHFYYYLTDKEKSVLVYNNLIHLCVMVKNGGELFEKMLTENLPIIDRWTILDTGSTDNTIEIINRVLEHKKGTLYQEPFINFRDSRNRCLDLAGTSCKFNLMLDDTYVVQGHLREFLETIRGDQFGDSYSICIFSDDMKYYSNRITKSENKLRYIYKIHEVISSENNTNVVIPISKTNIIDYKADYMEKRTMDRKHYDLQLLFEEIEENPDDPRHYYYVGQTYNLLGEYEKAAEYFLKRVNHKSPGFLQEKVDALFEAARTYNFKLNKPWEEVKKMYELCYKLDPERPEALYFLGVHYFLKDDYDTAYPYFVKAFEIGFPESKQYGLKPTLSFHFLPKFLAKICLVFKNYDLGFKCSNLFLKHNTTKDEDYDMIASMHKLFEHVSKLQPFNKHPIFPQKPTICFIVDGGYSQWSGSDILKNGVGGSETWAIEMATYIKKNFDVNVVFFCDCKESEIFQEVVYHPLSSIYSFLSTVKIHTCFVSRFTEYLSIANEAFVENIYLVLHDLGPVGSVIPMTSKLRKIICLTEWHKEYFNKNFPMCSSLSDHFYYGIDEKKFGHVDTTQKIPHSFIYSSFPNRGLSVLLKMWDGIREILPAATLNIYCDVYGKWVNQNYPEEMKEIQEYLSSKNNTNGITYHGWVSKQTLADAWKKTDIWFYPCKFAETFCLTALEAAYTKTFVITNGLAALENTVGDRGLIIPGDVTVQEWQDNALDKIRTFFTKDNSNVSTKEELVTKNYEWAERLTWENRAKEFFDKYINHLVSNDNISYLNIDKNNDDNKELSILQDVFDKLDDCVVSIDVGSYKGNMSKQLSKYCKNVYAFDLLKEYEKYENYTDISNIIFENIGISNNSSTANKIYLEKGDYNTRNIRIYGNFSNSVEYSYQYDITTLDEKFKDHMMNKDFKIGLINIDVNGSENEVIEGATEIINKYKPIILLNKNQIINAKIFTEKYSMIKGSNNSDNSDVNVFIYDEYKQENVQFTNYDVSGHWNVFNVGDFSFVKKLSNHLTRGIYVETEHIYFEQLIETHKNMFPNNKNVYIPKSSSSEEEDSICIDKIIEENEVKSLDLLYVDEERGLKILNSLDLCKVKPSYIIFNHIHFNDQIYETLIEMYKNSGYTVIKIDGNNTWLKMI